MVWGKKKYTSGQPKEHHVIQPPKSPGPIVSDWLVIASCQTYWQEMVVTLATTKIQNAQPSMLHTNYGISIYPGAVGQTDTGTQSPHFLDFIHLFPSFSSHFLLNFVFHFPFRPISSSLAVSFCPLHLFLLTIQLPLSITPPPPFLSLSMSPLLLSSPHLFPHPLISLSLTPLLSSKPSSERPIRLDCGFTDWGCEGKPKWNTAHLLE